MADDKVRVLVVGSGFGGVKTARELANHPKIKITILTDQEMFRYGATIWRTAAGHRKRESYMPVANLIQGYRNVNLVFDTATKIDRDARVVTTKSNKRFSYDYCVIAVGSVTSYYNIEGLEKYSYNVKSHEGLRKLQRHLHDELLSTGVLDKNYVVVGGGPTGVELSASLKEYMKKVARYHHLQRSKVNIELIEASPRLLPTMSVRASKLTAKRLRKLGVITMPNKKVEGETKNSLIVDKRSIPTHTVIWTAGVTNNPFFSQNPGQFLLDKRNKVIVDRHLQVDPYTFVIGDNASTPHSGLAITAIHDAKHVASFIKHRLSGTKVSPYKPHEPLIAIPVGNGWALVQKGKWIITGKLASAIRILYDLVGYAYIMGWGPALELWHGRHKLEEDCPTCQLELAK